MNNGKQAWKALCPTCTTGMYKIGALAPGPFKQEYPGENSIKPQPTLKDALNLLL